MSRGTLALLALSLCPATFAAPSITHQDQTWALENAALRVTIDARAGTYEVLDRASGYLWRGPDRGRTPDTTLALPRLDALPAAGLAPGQWPVNAATVPITPDMLMDARRVDGPADLSATVRAGWAPEGFWLGVRVTDEAVAPPAADDPQWWYRDTVEFWVGSRQYAIRGGPWGANLWSTTAVPEGARASWQALPDGYAVTAFIPAAATSAIARGPGAAFRFAVGINDCDAADGRQGQVYWPTTWVHSNPATFAVATLANPDGTVPAQAAPSELPALREPRPDAPGSLSFRLDASADNQPSPATVTFALEGDSPDLTLTLTPDDPDQRLGVISALHPLVLDRPGGRILGARYCDGIGVRTDDLSWAGTTWDTIGSLDMPWVGLTDGDIGYLLLWELPLSCDNGAARFDRVTMDGRTLLAPMPIHYGVKGRFAAPRTIRYAFCPSGGHVAICKRYRQYALDHGFLVTQAQKLRSKPQLARLAGAPDIWGRGDLQFCREAKAAGMDRLMVNGPQAAADMEEIKRLGYLISVYDNYEDAYQSDTGNYGDFTTDTDSLVLSNGELCRAWLTHDTPPKQFMKRCTALFRDVAARWIPLDLEAHPYNARFLDVTTACGLAECYSPTHPLDRTADRAARRALAGYVANDLGLVLGGEHGRWWGADIYNYWEGMQSGGFYSWPAGYVGEAIPQTREEIGREYLEWGLGETNRYPLWELVFHDCVVSTWYWGDSTGHLRRAAPELGYKQDAFNILYGTIPLYWVAHDYSYDWSKPETRERLLESYRNTCKLHEAIGFEEMLTHEFVTPDRAVQHTTFADGTGVWVNFGAQPWPLTRDGVTYTLPQYGFYAKGPQIELYRASLEDSAAPVNLVRRPGYIYTDRGIPGLVECSAPSGITLRAPAPGRISVSAAAGARVTLNWRALAPGAGEGPWWVLDTDAAGTPLALAEQTTPRGDLLTLDALPAGGVTLLGPSVLAAAPELVMGSLAPLSDAPVVQGQPVTLAATLRNLSPVAANGITVALYLGDLRPEHRLQTRAISVPAGGETRLQFTAPSDLLDGPCQFLLRADDDDQLTEVVAADNTAATTVAIAPDFTRWDCSRDFTVSAGSLERHYPVASTPFGLAEARRAAGRDSAGDPAAIRVWTLDAAGRPLAACVAQYLPEAYGGPRLYWQLPGTLPAGASVRCRVYMDAAVPARHRGLAASQWDEASQTVSTSYYRAALVDGYIQGLSIPALDLPVLTTLCVSSADTGWTTEIGKLDSFQVLGTGPLVTQIRVAKSLNGGHAYDKLYTFCPATFEVATLSDERFGSSSRAFYAAACNYADDAGHRVRVDGVGEAEGISGQCPDPRWYVTWDNAWSLSCSATLPADNATYWDAGGKGGISLDSWHTGPLAVTYSVHLDTRGGLDGPALAELDYRAAREPVTVTP